MKRTLILFFIFWVIVAPVFGQVKKSDMMRGAKLNEPKPPVTTMVVGANETAGSIAEPGWPIIISAAVLPEDGVAAANPPANLKVKVTDEKDLEVPLAFEAVPQPTTSNGEPKFFWLAQESATKALPPGRYHFTLEPVAGFAFESADLEVVATNPQHAGALGLLKIQRSLLLGQDDEALAETDRLTTSDAKNVDAWIAKGDILMGKDLPDEALKAYDQALELQKATDNEPLFIQERRRAAFFRSLEKRGVLSKSDAQ